MSDTFTSNRWTINLGSCIWGIPIKAHATFLALLLIQLIVGAFQQNILWLLYLFLMFGPILTITILVHEYGHAITTKLLGGQVDGIVLWPLGGFALCGPTDSGPCGDLKVAVAGPLAHIPQMIIWIGVYASVMAGDLTGFLKEDTWTSVTSGGSTGFFSAICASSFYFNAYLMVFNLFVPAYPLDGGRCLACILILCGIEVEKAALLTAISAIILGVLFGIIGLAMVFFYGQTSGLFMLLIVAFILESSIRLYKLVKEGRVLEHPLFGRECYQNQGSNGDSAVLRSTPISAPGKVRAPHGIDSV